MFHVHLIILLALYLSRLQGLRPAWELLYGPFEFPTISCVILAGVLAMLAMAALICMVDALCAWWMGGDY